jgi:GDPmannose 4,6-dehydratase
MKRALILGSKGQDGQFLSEKLLLDGYEVFGVIKPNTNSLQKNTISLDLTDIKNVEFVISKVKPTHIFNFAGVSDVFNPYDNLEFSYQQNCLIPQNFLNSILKIDKTIRFFQSSSSLMYGRSTINKINEETPTSPIYPYGITKLYSHNLIKEYREEFDLFCSSGIFFNHDSEKRGDKFLTQKIILGIKDILNKKTNTIKLGNIDVHRDISYAGDFMDAVKLMMESNNPTDYVLGSEKLTSIREFIEKSFNYVGLDYKNHIEQDKDFIRTKNDIILVSDITKIKNNLGWETTKNIDDIIKIMINDKIK